MRTLPVLLLKNSYSVTLLRTLHFSGSLVQFCFSIFGYPAHEQ